MSTEGAPVLAGDGEEAQKRRRAVATLLQLSQRMSQLAMDGGDLVKLRGELGGMSAWISAFTCQLAGIPVELTPMPGGDLLLASVELLPHTEKLVDGLAHLPGSGSKYEYRDAASKNAAIALALAGLGAVLLERQPPLGADATEPDMRHRRAEQRFQRLVCEAIDEYEKELDPDRGIDEVPEASYHGTGGVD